MKIDSGRINGQLFHNPVREGLPVDTAGMYLAAGTCSEVHVALLSVTGNICVAQWTACEFLESEQSRRDRRKCTPNKLLSWFVRAWR